MRSGKFQAASRAISVPCVGLALAPYSSFFLAPSPISLRATKLKKNKKNRKPGNWRRSTPEKRGRGSEQPDMVAGSIFQLLGVEKKGTIDKLRGRGPRRDKG